MTFNSSHFEKNWLETLSADSQHSWVISWVNWTQSINIIMIIIITCLFGGCEEAHTHNIHNSRRRRKRERLMDIITTAKGKLCVCGLSVWNQTCRPPTVSTRCCFISFFFNTHKVYSIYIEREVCTKAYIRRRYLSASSSSSESTITNESTGGLGATSAKSVRYVYNAFKLYIYTNNV